MASRLPAAPGSAKARDQGHFRLSFLEVRQGRRKPSPDPLALDRESSAPEKHWTPEKTWSEETSWGDQEPLSKIPFKIMKGHQHIVSSCHFCVDDTKLLSGSYDCTVKLWDAMDGSVVRDFEPGPGAPVIDCSVTADSRRIIAASYDKTVRAWDLETGKLLWKLSHETFIVSCKFSPDGKYVVSGLDVDRGIYITDAKDTTTVSHIKDHHGMSVTACCFDPDSQKVASVSLDRSIKIWDVTSQTTLLSITNGHFLCTSSWDKTLKIWNVHTGEFRNRGACVTLMQGHQGSVSSCHFARDRPHLWYLDVPSLGVELELQLPAYAIATALRDLSRICDLHHSSQQCRILNPPSEATDGTCILMDTTSFLVSGGFDRTVAIWDVGEGSRKLSLKGHTDWVMDVAISSNKKWILSASKDRTMRLWNIEEIDQVPLVIEYKKALGLKMKQCEECDRPFSIYESDLYHETVTKCVFCRMDARDVSAEALPSSEGEDLLASECSQGEDG